MISFSQKNTPYSEKFQEHYFNDGKGIEESTYVFLQQNKIKERFSAGESLTIGELGFGLGLNFFCTCDFFLKYKTHEEQSLYFISTEKYLSSKFNFEKTLLPLFQKHKIIPLFLEKFPCNIQGFHLINFYPYNIKLLLLIGEAETMLKKLSGLVDVWYLDGFSPKKNPSMWNKKILEQVALHSKNNTTFSTFSSAGIVKRTLEENNFKVFKTKGFLYKRHMLSGFYTNKEKQFYQTKNYYFFPKTEKNTKQTITIIGAGIAGCSIGAKLAQANYKVTILDKNATFASEASGNQAGLIHPMLYSPNNLLSEFNLQASLNSFSSHRNLQSKRYIQQMLLCKQDYEKFNRLYPMNKKIVRKNKNGYISRYGLTINPKHLCSQYLEHKNITTLFNSQINHINHVDNKWFLNYNNNQSINSDICIIASAFHAKNLIQCHPLDLRAIRGQYIFIKNKDLNYLPKISSCSKNYIIPQQDGIIVGASYHVDNNTLEESQQDTQQLLKFLAEVYPNILKNEPSDLSVRVAIRCASKDYFPIIGPIIDKDYFLKSYHDISHGKVTSHYPKAKYLPNLYIATGFNSRGFSYNSLASEIITSLIQGEVLPISSIIWEKIHSGRFLIQNLKRNLIK